MKMLLGTISFLLLVLGSATATERKTLTLSVNEILWLGNALSALDGHDRVTKDGEREVVIKEPYKFAPGLRLVIARNMTAIRPFIVDTQAVAKALGNDTAAIDKLGFEKHAVDLVTFGESELDLVANAIPPSVLSGLSPILESK